MYELLKHEYDNSLENNHSDKQDEIADVLKKQEDEEENQEYMEKHNIDVLIRLAQYYYGTDGVADYSSYTWKEPEVWNAAYLYTLIKYEGQNLLVHIGTWEFNTEVFTRRNIPKLTWFSHGPLKLFVVSAWARANDKDSEPEIFLNNHALIYSPKWGQAELRISHKQREKAINYRDNIGIINYQDALLALKNAEIHKAFPLEKSLEKEKSFEKFVEKMEELKKFTPEELQKRTNKKEGYRREDDHDKEFNRKTLTCLWRLSDGNIKNMYKLIKSFDVFQKAFTKPLHKKDK